MLQSIKKEDFEFFYPIMKYSFPENERRSKSAQRALFDDARYKVAAERDELGKIVAFMAYWELDDVTYLEHFAVDRELRGAGLGGAFLDELTAGLNGPVVLEAEPPETEIAARRIAFYERHGFVLNDYDYIQPPLGKNRRPVPLKVMSLAAPLGREQFDDIRRKIYSAVYGVDPSDYV